MDDLSASLLYSLFYFTYTSIIFGHTNQADISLQSCSFILSGDLLQKEN